MRSIKYAVQRVFPHTLASWEALRDSVDLNSFQEHLVDAACQQQCGTLQMMLMVLILCAIS